MKSFSKVFFIITGAIMVLTLFANYKNGNREYYFIETSFPDTANRLLTVRNLSDFFYGDNGYSIDTLTAHARNPDKPIRSISVYRYSEPTHAIILQDSILMDSKGNPIVSMMPYGGRFSSTYYFYDDRGNRYLNITLLENKYDTLYTLRKFDKLNRPIAEIQYNITRKELNYLVTTAIARVSDSMLNLKRTLFEPDLNDKKVLPFESKDMSVKIATNGIAEMLAYRNLYSDTSIHSASRMKFRLENNCLVPENYSVQFTYDSEGNWTERKTGTYHILRSFLYNKQDTKENIPGIHSEATVLNFLATQLDSLPFQAWVNFRKKQNSFALRSQMFENGDYGDSIGLTAGKTLNAFLPRLWYQVCESQGNIIGIDSNCFAVGYNTPLKSDDGYNKRCLAIYEYKNGIYRLVKQSFGAIEGFSDTDDDLLFNGFDETNFMVEIEEGNVVIHNEYMRGSASYEYAFEQGNWILVSFSSSHLTCCQAESASYDYRTKIFTSSVSSLGDDNNEDESVGMSRDTTITIIQHRPVMYMDSVTIKGLEYNEDDN